MIFCVIVGVIVFVVGVAIVKANARKRRETAARKKVTEEAAIRNKALAEAARKMAPTHCGAEFIVHCEKLNTEKYDKHVNNHNHDAEAILVRWLGLVNYNIHHKHGNFFLANVKPRR